MSKYSDKKKRQAEQEHLERIDCAKRHAEKLNRARELEAQKRRAKHCCKLNNPELIAYCGDLMRQTRSVLPEVAAALQEIRRRFCMSLCYTTEIKNALLSGEDKQ